MPILTAAALLLAAQGTTTIDALPPVTGPVSQTLPPVLRKPVTIPAPIIKYTGRTTSQKDGRTWVSYTYELVNRDAYPAVFWTPAPSLPPCGANTKASRAWVEIFATGGKKLYGYCAETSTTQFKRFGFTLEAGTPPPPGIHVTVTDRFTGRVFTSNTAPTGDAPPPPVIH